MISFILRRLLALIPMLIGISFLVFLLMYVAPGDFLNEARQSKDISPEIVRQQEAALGLDKPWYVQYGMWLNSVSPVKTKYLLAAAEQSKHAPIYFGAPDFGYSWSYKISATSLIGQRLWATLGLALASLFLTYATAIPLGVLAAMKKDSWFDKISSFLSYAALSIPYFFLALLAVLFAAVTGFFPTGGQYSIMFDFLPPSARLWDYLSHLILPTLVLSLGGIASVMRVMRGNFLDFEKAEFAVTARAKGLSENAVMFKHVLRNALNPIITSFGFAFSGLLSGALLVENVMNYPGLGQLIYTAIIKQDQYVVMAGVVMGCVMLVFGQLVADIMLAAADPRIRLENPRIPFKATLGALGAAAAACVFFTYLAEAHEALFKKICDVLLYAGYALLIALAAALVIGLLWAALFFLKNFFKPLVKTWRGASALAALGILYFGAIFAQFIAPYDESLACLDKSFHPPMAPVFKDGRPCFKVYENTDPSIARYEPVKGAYIPVKFFVKTAEYKLWGFIPCSTKLFGADAPQDPSARIYLMGSDSTGRDVFSRLLYGARISLSIGFVGIAITMVMGFVVGGLSGYFGGAFDFMAMRLVEFLMAVPGLYLLLAMRSALAPHFDSAQMYLMIIIILSMLGWAGAARVIRGMSLSLANRQFVQAAESMGQSPVKIILKHFLPNVLSYIIVSATLSIPAYILGEAALSFLNLGIQEPSASWGLMLAQAQSDTKVLMLGFWWMLLPGAAIFVTVLAFNMLGDVLRDIADPKREK